MADDSTLDAGKQGREPGIVFRAFGRIVDTVAAYGAYFIYPDQKRGDRNAPDPALFDLVLWNVVIAFFVNLLASVAFERAQEWKRRRPKDLERPFTKDQIAALHEEIQRDLDTLPLKQRRTLIGAGGKAPLEALLISFGMPRQEAGVLAEQVEREFGAVLEEWAGGHKR